MYMCIYIYIHTSLFLPRLVDKQIVTTATVATNLQTGSTPVLNMTDLLVSQNSMRSELQWLQSAGPMEWYPY